MRVRVRGSFPSPSEGGKREGYYEKRRWRAHDTYLRAREESHSRPDNARNNNKEDNQGQKNSVEEGERKRKRLSQQRAVSNSHPRPTRGWTWMGNINRVGIYGGDRMGRYVLGLLDTPVWVSAQVRALSPTLSLVLVHYSVSAHPPVAGQTSTAKM